MDKHEAAWGPQITVGIMDRQTHITGCLHGRFEIDGFGVVSGRFSAEAADGCIVLTDGGDQEIVRSASIRLEAHNDSSFQLFHVTIGNRFHWERKEDQLFQGTLILCSRPDGTIAVINEVPLETYLASVISSEMSATAPPEFLKAHAILSRSWLLAALARRRTVAGTSGSSWQIPERSGEVIRWYDREDHDLYDVCADDHCQRYQGISKITSQGAQAAVRQTYGMVITYRNEICDARYSKACGGLTEEFSTAWDDTKVPYLASVSDALTDHRPIGTEEEAARWIMSAPDAYCNTKDLDLLATILPGFDRETTDFFRWVVKYPRRELEEILCGKSGFDFGTLREIVPLERGPSGRIRRLRIAGSKMTVEVGKELEIRRWLSKSHLYSSAFVVEVSRDFHGEADHFAFYGAGWGHGVGLCQIGAAVMSARGFSAEQILKHYFRGVEIGKIY